MSDKMSQNEIDDLLSALSAGEVDVKNIEEDPKKKVKKYDFRRPDKFSKEQLRTLEVIHENLSRYLTNFLSGYLRSSVEVRVISTESMIFGEFNNSISNPAIIGVVDFAPLEGHILIEFGRNIAFLMIDRLLGGLGKNPLPKEKRSITEIEEILIRGIMEKLISMMKEAWSAVIELTPKLGNIETNSQFSQLFSSSESIALVTCSVNLGDSDGLINIVIPFVVIEPILENLSSRFWFTGKKKKNQTETEYSYIESEIEKTDIDLRVVAGSSSVTVGELLTLGVGDIIVLNNEVEDEMKIYVGGELKYLGVPGTSRKKMAIKVTSKYQGSAEGGK